MAQLAMFNGIDGSPKTYLSAALSESATSASITNLEALPSAPNLVTFWTTDETWETCRYTAKSAATGSGTITIERSGDYHSSSAANGALSFESGAKVGRNPTAYDQNASVANITDLNAAKIDATGVTFVNLNANGCVGTTSTTVSQGDHTHPYVGYNYIINPCFEINQEGTGSVSAFGEYPADQWAIGADGGGNISAVRESLGPEYAVSLNGSKNFLSASVSVAEGAGCRSIAYQNIEGVRTLAGKTVTLSFNASATGENSIAVDFIQHMGSGGSPSADVTGIGATKVSLTGDITIRRSVTFVMPSLSGKTLGTNGDDWLQLIFWFSAGEGSNSRTGNLGLQTGAWWITNVKLEEGPVATPFVVPRLDEELSKCQRFFEVMDFGTSDSPIGGYLILTQFAAGGGAQAYLQYIAPKRTAPTITFVNSGNCRVVSSAGIAASVSLTATTITRFGISINTNTTLGAGYGWIDGIGVIKINARL